jgi:tryptophan halogenase
MNIVVVGGGTAGWLTALYAKKIFNNEKIILVESDQVGILGAGEGTTPHLIPFLDFLNIPVSDLIKNTKTTIKNGIKFNNWSEDKDFYYHPFYSNSKFSNDENFFISNYEEFDFDFSHLCANYNNHKNYEYQFIHKLSEKNLIPFSINKDNENFFDQFGHWSIHFDANVLAKYLRSVGEKRGIIRKEGIVDNVVCDKDGYITELKTNKETIASDFVFDCTGFKRLIIGNFYKSKWKSYSKCLPAKKAIPFFLPITENIPPYTEAIAMNYGWMWKIPLQHRFGCGYVFDSDFVSEDDAKKEIDEFLGFEVDSSRTFNFNAGAYEKIWIKNCLAVGLSSGFVEPLEASSIFQSIRILKNFLSNKQNVYSKNEKNKEYFNKTCLKDTQEIVDFLYFHYVTNKKNTNFWSQFLINNNVPEFIQYILEIIQERPLNEFDFQEKNIFNLISYNYVLFGNNLINKKTMNDYYKNFIKDKNFEYYNILTNQENIDKIFVSHNSFIKKIKEI